MEKYGVENSILVPELKQREAHLMQKLSQLIHTKTASPSEYRQVEEELQQIRTKITSIDLGISQA